MAGVAGTNVDIDNYILDPLLDNVKQHYKEVMAHPHLRGRLRHVSGGYRTVTIPTASVLTLNSVPVQIVPAPGAGLMLVPYLMVGSLVYKSATYAVNASGASLKYGTAGAGTSTGFTFTQGFLQTGSGTAIQVVNQSSSATYLPATTDVNVPLTLIAASSDPTTGDSDLYVRVYYYVLTVPFTNPAAP